MLGETGISMTLSLITELKAAKKGVAILQYPAFTLDRGWHAVKFVDDRPSLKPPP